MDRSYRDGMLHDLAMIFLGGVLVYFGVIGGAIAERVRGVHRRAPKASAPMGSERAAEWTDAVTPKVERPAVQRKQKIATFANADLVPVPMLNDVRDALVRLGYAKPLATQAAADARRKLGDGAPLEVWIREALQFCKPPVESVTSYSTGSF